MCYEGKNFYLKSSSKAVDAGIQPNSINLDIKAYTGPLSTCVDDQVHELPKSLTNEKID